MSILKLLFVFCPAFAFWAMAMAFAINSYDRQDTFNQRFHYKHYEYMREPLQLQRICVAV